MNIKVTAQLVTPTGDLKTIQIKDSKCFNIESNYYSEIWDYHIMLNNEIEVQLNFTISEFGSLKKRVTGTQVRVLWNDGNSYTINKEYHLNQLIFNTEEYLINMHENRSYWATQIKNNSQELLFDTKKNKTDIHLDLTLFNIEAGKVWGDGVFKVDKDSVLLEYLIPNANVKGKLAVNYDTLSVTGVASMTHSYKTGSLVNKTDFELAYWTQKNQTKYISTIFSLDKNTAFGYGLKQDTSGYSLLIPDSYINQKYMKIRNFKVPTEFEINYNNSNLVHKYKMDTLKDHYSILDDLSGFTKMIAKQLFKKEILDVMMSGMINEHNPSSVVIITSDTY